MAKRRRADTGFGERLRQLRELAGLTQTELGERAGMQHQTIAKYERNVSEPMWGVVLRLAAALDVPTDAFKRAEPSVPEPIAPVARPSKRK